MSIPSSPEINVKSPPANVNEHAQFPEQFIVSSHSSPEAAALIPSSPAVIVITPE